MRGYGGDSLRSLGATATSGEDPAIRRGRARGSGFRHPQRRAIMWTWLAAPLAAFAVGAIPLLYV